METLGWICISTAAALMVMLGLYGLVPLVATFSQAFSPGRLRTKIGGRMPRPIAGATAAPALGSDHLSQMNDPVAESFDARSIDELFSEIFALREVVADMSAQISALRLSLAGEQRAPPARLKGPSMQRTA